MPDGVVQYVSKRRLYRTSERSENPAAPSLAAGNST
jgi:nicotinate-nucleotide adenylyltransferase